MAGPGRDFPPLPMLIALRKHVVASGAPSQRGNRSERVGVSSGYWPALGRRPSQGQAALRSSTPRAHARPHIERRRSDRVAVGPPPGLRRGRTVRGFDRGPPHRSAGVTTAVPTQNSAPRVWEAAVLAAEAVRTHTNQDRRTPRIAEPETGYRSHQPDAWTKGTAKNLGHPGAEKRTEKEHDGQTQRPAGGSPGDSGGPPSLGASVPSGGGAAVAPSGGPARGPPRNGLVRYRRLDVDGQLGRERQRRTIPRGSWLTAIHTAAHGSSHGSVQCRGRLGAPEHAEPGARPVQRGAGLSAEERRPKIPGACFKCGRRSARSCWASDECAPGARAPARL
ncbi:hypothetical protein HPB47_006531 [Ixodes persulcatus]|uniref:Uncharacterized protein n=1 Tax=Ixodes persulcatus TaxID=34615 RepID=A0AC60PA90_IXOPE|nr:hypothetical protein HPB47_006531 [Ixodes persulcatus]